LSELLFGRNCLFPTRFCARFISSKIRWRFIVFLRLLSGRSYLFPERFICATCILLEGSILQAEKDKIKIPEGSGIFFFGTHITVCQLIFHIFTQQEAPLSIFLPVIYATATSRRKNHCHFSPPLFLPQLVVK
jgi:hypothetical protein